jgi:ABC-type Fe3+-hydroxamate transport system substrate-binding protein
MGTPAIRQDDLSRRVRFNFPPCHIVSLCPSITETIFVLGAGDLLSGRTRYCIHPAGKVASVPEIGGTKDPDIEAILKIAPDLVIAEKEENTRRVIEKLEKEIPVFVFSVESFAQALAMISGLGELTGKITRASGLIKRIEQAFAELPPAEAKTAAYLIWEKPLMAAGKNTFIDAMMEKAGFRNIFRNKSARYPKISLTELSEEKPEVLILSTEPCAYTLEDVKRYRRLLPETEVILIEGDLFSWYGARMLKAAEYIKGVLSASFR